LHQFRLLKHIVDARLAVLAVDHLLPDYFNRKLLYRLDRTLCPCYDLIPPSIDLTVKRHAYMGDEEYRRWSQEHLVNSYVLRCLLLTLLALKLTQILEIQLLPALSLLVEIDLICKEEIYID
jgi:hypothetical protein